MEKWKVIGFRKVDFTDTKQNSRVTGYSLYVCRPGGNDMSGDECQKIFFSDQRISYVPSLGDEIQLMYNRYGKIADIILM